MLVKVKTIGTRVHYYFLQFVAGRKTHCCESMRRNSSARVVHSIRQSVLKVTVCMSIYRTNAGRGSYLLFVVSVQCCARCWRATLLVFIRTEFRCTWMKYQSTSGRRTKRHLSFDPKGHRSVLPSSLQRRCWNIPLWHPLQKISNQYRPSRESPTNKRKTNQNDVQ